MSDQPKATAQDVIDTLKSIDTSIKALCQHFGVGTKPQLTEQSGNARAIASDSDLDGKYGNPAVRAKSPRDWTGEDQLGKPFSECPPEYLEMVADRLDYFVDMARETLNDENASPDDKESARKTIKYSPRDAARARGWAARIRSGWKPPVAETGFPSDNGAPLTEDDIAF